MWEHFHEVHGRVSECGHSFWAGRSEKGVPGNADALEIPAREELR